MNHELDFIRLKTHKIYYDESNIVTSLIQRFIKKFRMIKFKIPTHRGEASVSATFLPQWRTLKQDEDIVYSVIVCTSLSSNNKSGDIKLSFIENELCARIENSSKWNLRDFKQYLVKIPNIITMTAPALRKGTHLTYDLFSSDDVIGEIYVPDMVNVFFTKLKRDDRLKKI